MNFCYSIFYSSFFPSSYEEEIHSRPFARGWRLSWNFILYCERLNESREKLKQRGVSVDSARGRENKSVRSAFIGLCCSRVRAACFSLRHELSRTMRPPRGCCNISRVRIARNMNWFCDTWCPRRYYFIYKRIRQFSFAEKKIDFYHKTEEKFSAQKKLILFV